MAQAITAVLAPDDLRRAIASDDVKTLTRVPGIGPKVAQRMVLELKDKVGTPAAVAATPAATGNGGSPRRDQVVEALLGLGFTAKPAEAAVEQAADAHPDADASTLLRTALTQLGRSR